MSDDTTPTIIEYQDELKKLLENLASLKGPWVINVNDFKAGGFGSNMDDRIASERAFKAVLRGIRRRNNRKKRNRNV